MKTFKIFNLQTWEITRVKADTLSGAKRMFKTLKNLKTFDESLYEVREHGGRKAKTYNGSSFSHFEQKEFYNRK